MQLRVLILSMGLTACVVNEEQMPSPDQQRIAQVKSLFPDACVQSKTQTTGVYIKPIEKYLCIYGPDTLAVNAKICGKNFMIASVSVDSVLTLRTFACDSTGNLQQVGGVEIVVP